MSNTSSWVIFTPRRKCQNREHTGDTRLFEPRQRKIYHRHICDRKQRFWTGFISMITYQGMEPERDSHAEVTKIGSSDTLISKSRKYDCEKFVGHQVHVRLFQVHHEIQNTDSDGLGLPSLPSARAGHPSTGTATTPTQLLLPLTALTALLHFPASPPTSQSACLCHPCLTPNYDPTLRSRALSAHGDSRKGFIRLCP